MFWKKQAARMAALEARVTALEQEVAYLALRCGAASQADRRQAARDSAREKLEGEAPDAGAAPRYATIRGPDGHDWDGQQVEILEQSSVRVTTQLGSFFSRWQVSKLLFEQVHLRQYLVRK